MADEYLRDQETLLAIVETWRPNGTPEYRGFRCANCQEYKNRAWYHWLNLGGYRLPIHLCNDKCHELFIGGNLKVDRNKRLKLDRSNFGIEYPEKSKERFLEIVYSWPENKDPELKNFICDECGNDLVMEKLPDGSMQRQGYHVWYKMSDGKMLAELHFHRDCGESLLK